MQWALVSRCKRMGMASSRSTALAMIKNPLWPNTSRKKWNRHPTLVVGPCLAWAGQGAQNRNASASHFRFPPRRVEVVHPVPVQFAGFVVAQRLHDTCGPKASQTLQSAPPPVEPLVLVFVSFGLLRRNVQIGTNREGSSD